MGRTAHLRRDGTVCQGEQVSATEILVSICGLAALEVLHLKWIVWEHWDCRNCGTKNRECGHLPVWAKLL
jgi:hypothetical protein